MSYGINISFKNCKKDEIYDKINEFEELLLKNAEEHIEKNTYFCRYDTKKDRWENDKEINRFILSLFRHHIWYCKDISALCFVIDTSIEEIRNWFDGIVYFQDSCDQNYDYEDWLFNDKFKSIVNWVQGLDEEQFKKEYLKEHEFYDEDEIDFDDYDKKTLVYAKCYALIEDIWCKGFGISCVDAVTDYNYDLYRLCIGVLSKKFKDFRKIYK